MKVRESMSTNVRLANPDQTIQEAAQAMAEVDSGVLPPIGGTEARIASSVN